jgi:hypothetical protein
MNKCVHSCTALLQTLQWFPFSLRIMWKNKPINHKFKWRTTLMWLQNPGFLVSDFLFNENTYSPPLQVPIPRARTVAQKCQMPGSCQELWNQPVSKCQVLHNTTSLLQQSPSTHPFSLGPTSSRNYSHYSSLCLLHSQAVVLLSGT